MNKKRDISMIIILILISLGIMGIIIYNVDKQVQDHDKTIRMLILKQGEVQVKQETRKFRERFNE